MIENKDNNCENEEERLSEYEEVLINSIYSCVGNSVERLEAIATDMLKYSVSLMTVSVAIGKYVNMKKESIVFSLALYLISIVLFIIIQKPSKMTYIPGNVDSMIGSYENVKDSKSLKLNLAYFFFLTALIAFLFNTISVI